MQSSDFPFPSIMPYFFRFVKDAAKTRPRDFRKCLPDLPDLLDRDTDGVIE